MLFKHTAVALTVLFTSVLEHAYSQSSEADIVRIYPGTDEFKAERDWEKQLQIPRKYSKVKGVSIQIESSNGIEVVFLLVNNTGKSIFFAGTGMNAPWYRKQVRDSAKEEKEEDMGRFCLTGLYSPGLKPYRCSRFSASCLNKLEFRVGLGVSSTVDCDGEPTSVWSAWTRMGEQDVPPKSDRAGG